MTLGGTTLFVFADGPRQVGWARLLPFAGAVALFDQAVMLGLQLLIPGVALFLVLCMLPLTAARADDDDSWVLAALWAIGRSPASYLVVMVGAVVGIVAPMGMVALLYGGQGLLEGLMDATARPPAARIAVDVQTLGFRGLALAIACVLYDQRTADGS